MTFQSEQRKATERARRESKAGSARILEYYRRADEAIEKKLEVLYNRILSEIEPAQYYEYLRETNRLEPLLAEIRAIEEYYENLIAEELERGARISFINNFYYQQYMASWTSTTVSFVSIDMIAVELAVYHTDKRWANLKSEARKNRMRHLRRASMNKPTLSSFLVMKRDNHIQRVQDELINGLITGQGYRSTATLIANATAMNYRDALKVVRTEGNSNLNASNYWNMKNYRDQGLDARRQIRSVKDRRTRRQSAQVDGQKETMPGEYFVYPGGVHVTYPGSSGKPQWDINDRETVISLYAGLEPTAQRARNPITGKYDIIDASLNFDDWMKMHNLTRLKDGEIVSKDPVLREQQMNTIRAKRRRDARRRAKERKNA